MFGAPLSQPRWVRENVLVVPVALAAAFAMIIYVPSFSQVLFLLALVVWPAMTAWCVALFFWAGRRRLTGHSPADRRVLLETTAAVLPQQAVGAPVLGTLSALIGVRCFQAEGLVGSPAATFVVVGYLMALGMSYLFLSDLMVRLELQRVQLPRSTLLGRMLAPGVPSFTAMAIFGLFLSAVLVRLGAALLFGGAGFLLVAPYLIHASVVNLERWRRFRRFMRTERQESGANRTEP
jgi:hypothetical protein